MNFVIRRFGLLDYRAAYTRMQAFTSLRTAETPDEIWLLQHEPVYTLGLAGRMEAIHDAAGIPVVSTDRGGQVTYHGPGQLIAYVLVDLKRRGYGVRRLVNRIEQALIDYLGESGLSAARRTGAPGVYVGDAKIAALGLRVKNGCSYHGLALNVDMDLGPFSRIDPCGYPGLQVAQLRDYGIQVSMHQAGQQLLSHLCRQLQRLPAPHAGMNRLSTMRGQAHV